MEKVSILIEALPYIQRFQGRTVVVKLGGSAMSNPACLLEALRDVVFLETVRVRPVLIHGGGKRISERMKAARVAADFVEGLRVTDAKTVRIVREVLAEINGELVDKIEGMGGRARGMLGSDGPLLTVRKHPPVKTAAGETVDVGLVGEVTSVKTEFLRRVFRKSAVPIIAPLGKDGRGRIHNINGDAAAAEVAAALKAEKLVFLTDVEGIVSRSGSGEERQLLSSLNRGDIENLLREGIIGGGMIPKVKAGLRALEKGVKKIHIIDGRLKHSLLLEIFTEKGIGTEIVK